MRMKLGLKLFFDNPVLNTAIAIQLAITLLLVNLIVGKFNLLNSVFEYSENIPDDVYSVLNGGRGDVEGREAELKAIAEKYSDEVSLEGVYNELVRDDDRIYRMLGYEKNTAEIMNVKLMSGEWFSDKELIDGCIPCVATRPHRVGDVIELTMHYRDDYEYFENPYYNPIGEPNLIPREIKFVVVGTIYNERGVLAVSGGSTTMRLNYLFPWESQDVSEEPMILYSVDHLQKFDFHVVNRATTQLLFFKTDDETLRQQIVDELSSCVWVSDMATARANTRSSSAEEVTMFASILVAIFAVGFVSSLSMSFLNAYNNVRAFTVYHICGMRWRDSIMIMLSYVLCVMALATLIATVLTLLLMNSIFDYQSVMWGMNNAVLTAAVIALNAGMSILGPYVLLKQKSAVVNLHKSW